VWAEAGKWLTKFDEAVLTVIDRDGYPASMRVSTSAYNAATGELAAPLMDALHAVEGPADLLCHSHDDKMWSLQMITVKGTLEKRDGEWIFRSTSFVAPSKLAMLDFIGNARKSAQKYLDKRGLARPVVNWQSIKDLHRRAKAGNG
jgi:hypothetical protein